MDTTHGAVSWVHAEDRGVKPLSVLEGSNSDDYIKPGNEFNTKITAQCTSVANSNKENELRFQITMLQTYNDSVIAGMLGDS